MKTSELDGAQLNWAVAKCEGYIDDCCSWLYEATLSEVEDGHYKPSTNWSQGGPIIERESIRLMPEQGATYVDCVWLAGNANEDGDEFNGEGPTPLIAAMRCYVASKLGDTVDIPEELV